MRLRPSRETSGKFSGRCCLWILLCHGDHCKIVGRSFDPAPANGDVLDAFEMNQDSSTTLAATEPDLKRRSGGFQLFMLLCLSGATRLAWMAILPASAFSLDILTWKGMAYTLV